MAEKLETCRKAIEKFGIKAQVGMMHEEMCELGVALEHWKRDRCKKEDVVTEIADVMIVAAQMALYFGKEEVDAEIDRKLERLEGRMKGESEDETIRKKMIEHFKSKKKETWCNMPIKSILAYLEKQKESQPLMRDGEIEDRKRDIVAAIRKYYPTDYAEYLTSFLKGLSPEDNSKDEYGQEMLGIAYKLMYEHIPENLRTQEFWDSLKFMREYTGRVAIIHSYEKPAEQLSGIFTSYDMAKTFTEGQNYVIAHPEKFGLCKPAEWSEEEKGILLECVSVLQNSSHWLLADKLSSLRPQPKAELTLLDENIIKAAIAFVEQNDHFNCSGGIDKQTVIKALRSLKPHWKPSEEQMKILRKYVMGEWRDLTIGQDKILTSLYNDLESL